MAVIKATTLRRVFTLTVAVLLDLSLFYASGCTAALHVFGHLARLWISAALRCLTLTAVTLLSLGELKPLLIRLITVHSLLPAVLETGSQAVYNEEAQCGLLADTSCWLMCAGASLAAALFWELAIPDNGGDDKETKQKSRELFVRVLLLYKPYYHLLFGGFGFLTMAVICKLPADDDAYQL